MIYATWLFVALAVFASCWAIATYIPLIQSRRLVNARLYQHVAFLPQGDRPNVALNWLERIGRRLAGRRPGTAIKVVLAQAGYFEAASFYVFSGIRICMAVIAASGVAAAYGARQPFDETGLLLSLFSGWIAFRLVETLLKLKAERRARAVRGEFPYVLDILLMVLGSGVSIDQCLRYAASTVGIAAPISAGILTRYVSEIDSGLPYDTAIERMGKRFGVDEAQEVANVIRQSLVNGGDLSKTLHRFARDILDKRLTDARESIGRKSIYLTLVMLGFFVPVLLIALAGPAAYSLIDTLSSAATTLTERTNHP